MDALNPYSDLLAKEIASSFVCTSRMLRIGPKISSFAFLLSAVVSYIVGVTKQPSICPPTNAPSLR